MGLTRCVLRRLRSVVCLPQSIEKEFNGWSFVNAFSEEASPERHDLVTGIIWCQSYTLGYGRFLAQSVQSQLLS